jgi:crotonobetainyl-CoA:carnitine CoA-transferase CaiB-like acyl-CoA transferase
MSPNRRPYRTADGYVCCLVYTDKHWKTFLTAAGKPELLVQDPRLRDIGTRTANIDALYQLVADELLHKTTAQWQQQLAEAVAANLWRPLFDADDVLPVPLPDDPSKNPPRVQARHLAHG